MDQALAVDRYLQQAMEVPSHRTLIQKIKQTVLGIADADAVIAVCFQPPPVIGLGGLPIHAWQPVARKVFTHNPQLPAMINKMKQSV